jgi:bifunctional oligoribonuclease and PAP phosphatase NrnA
MPPVVQPLLDPTLQAIAPAMSGNDLADLDGFIQALQTAKSLFITAHVGPDGDTLGAMLGVKQAILSAPQHFGQLQRIDCVIAGKMPTCFGYLPGIADVISVDADGAEQRLLPQYDAALSVDCGSVDRLGPSQAWFNGATNSLNLDHHISNKRFAHHNLVLTQAASSTQVVAIVLAKMGIALTPETADCLYTGLLTDTGGFKYGNTTANVFRLAAHLTQAGARNELIFKRMFEDRPRCQVALQAEVMQQAQFNAPATLAWAMVSREQLASHKALDEHTEGLVEQLRQIDTVQVACLLKATPEGHTKISLRSDNHALSVAAVVEPLGGGGHKMAAGCTVKQSVEDTWAMLGPILTALVAGL